MRRTAIAFGLSAIFVALSFVFAYLNGDVEHGATAAWNGYGEVASWGSQMLVASVLGVLVARSRPDNRVADVFAWAGLLGSAAMFGDMYAGYALETQPGSVYGGVGARFASFAAFAATWFVAAVVLPAVFPTGHLVSRRWRFVLWTGALGAATWSLLIFRPDAFRDNGLLGEVEGVTNPIAVPALASVIRTISDLGILLLFGAMFLAIASLVVRTVRSHGVERQQVKVVAYTIVVTTVGHLMVANVIDVVAFPGETIVWNVVSQVLVLAVPVSIAIAVVRYRLYDIDRLINRTVVYALLSALLAGVYVGSIVLFGYLARPVTRGSDVSIAAATLVIVVLFGPLRRRVQGFIDRRFYRTRYDAARTLEAFVGRLRSETDLSALGAEIETVARQTLKPTYVALWLPPGKPGRRVLR